MVLVELNLFLSGRIRTQSIIFKEEVLNTKKIYLKIVVLIMHFILLRKLIVFNQGFIT